MATVLVECSFRIPVEVPDDWITDGTAQFAIEENGCPGTGVVGAALTAHMDRHDEAGTCWACALNASNRIVTESAQSS